MVFRKIIVLAILSAAPMVAMERQGPKRKHDEEQSRNLKKRDERMDIRNLIETESPPTFKEIVCAFYQGKLTSEMVTKYALERLRVRIAYWRVQYKHWKDVWEQKVNKGEELPQAMKELVQIPFYITHAQKEVRPEDMLDRVMLYSDSRAPELHQNFVDSFAHHGIVINGWEFYSKRAEGYTMGARDGRSSVLFLKDFVDSNAAKYRLLADPYLFLQTIEHELSHVEQVKNRERLQQLFGINIGSDLFNYMGACVADRTAYRLYMNTMQWSVNNRDYESFNIEAEAEYKSLLFHPSRIGIKRFFLSLGHFSGVTTEQEGYYSTERALNVLSTLSVSPEEEEEYDKINEANVNFGKCDHSKQQQRYVESLKKK